MDAEAIDLHRVREPYAHLRVRDAAAEARLLAAIAERGQTSPVWVTEDHDETVIIDGHRRVRSLRQLHVDTVRVLRISLEPAHALAETYRLEAHGRRSAIEEGWLVRELSGLIEASSLEHVGRLLGRSAAWCSRRLALIKVVPADAEAAVRAGRIPAHAAVTYLVPLSRGNAAHCARLVRNLGEQRVSSRQVAMLYATWKGADDEQRERIVEQPWLLLRSLGLVAAPNQKPDAIDRLIRGLDGAARAAWRAHHFWGRCAEQVPAAVRQARVRKALARLCEASDALRDLSNPSEKHDAGSGDAHRDLQAAR
jgi:ParB-like chromosome segregation protein Spo0J